MQDDERKDKFQMEEGFVIYSSAGFSRSGSAMRWVAESIHEDAAQRAAEPKPNED